MNKLLSKAHLGSLVLGDSFETPGVLHTLSPEEPMTWRLVEVTNGNRFTLALSYMGCEVGEVVATVVGDQVTVKESS